MKDLDLEMKGLAMDGGDDYDEYEEEVIDRDEDYEDEDAEEYDEGDEDYGDEEYDEEYDDDGYDDNYYDERLNKVLDELAELKRSMANPPAVQNNQPNYSQPSIPYVYAGNLPQTQANNSGNDVVMYNEISRLRDELSKTQSSQNLHVELNRLKDEMERDRKYNESQYQNEIKRLNEKIETLQKNSLSPLSEDNAYLPESSASEGRAIDSGSFNKLIAINESILQNSRNTDSHVQSELSEIKKRLSALDMEEINRSLSSVKKMTKNGLNSEDVAALTSEIASVKQLVSAGGGVALPAPTDAKITCALEELKSEANRVDSDEIAVLKKLYEINRLIGYSDKEEEKEKEQILALMNEFLLLKADCLSKEKSFGELLFDISAFGTSLSQCAGADALPLAIACNRLMADVIDVPVDKKTAEDVMRFADETAAVSIGREKRDNIEKFILLSQRMLKSESQDVADILPEIIEIKAKLQDSVKQEADLSVRDELLRLIAANSDENESKIKELCSVIADLKVSDILKYPKVSLTVAEKGQTKSAISIMAKIDAILGMLRNGGTSVGAVSETAAGLDLEEVKNEISLLCTCKQLDDAIADLKAQYLKIINSLSSVSSLSTGDREIVSVVNEETGEAQYTNNELSDQVYNIRDELSKAIHDENILTQDTVELKLTDFTESQLAAQQQTSEDLEFIKTKLADAEELINQISDIRSDILSLPALIDLEPQFGKIYEELCAQFDKLYEDFSTLLANAENNIVERVNESVGATMDNVNAIIDTINGNIDNINAVVGGVNTTLEGINSNFEITNENINNVNNAVNDNLLTISTTLDEVRENVAGLVAADVSPVIADNLAELKISVDDFIAKAAANDEAALTDRLKLLDDISFLRQQVENSQIEETETEDGLSEQQTIYRELEDTKEKITQDLLVLSDSITNLNIDDIRDNMLTIKDTLDIIATDSTVGVLSEDIAEIKENNRTLLDSFNNNLAADLDFKAALQEDISFIRSKLDSEVSDEAAENETENVTVGDVYNTLNEVSNKLTLLESGGIEDTQTLISYLEDIKEQLHLKELEPSIEGLTDNEEEKQTLLNEIAEVRERLANVEVLSKDQSDTAMVQLGIITDELNLLKDAVENMAPSADLSVELNALSEKINEIAENSNSNAVQLSNLALILEDIAQIKETLEAESAVNAESGTDSMSEILQTVNDMSDRVRDFAERMDLACVDIESIPLVLAEINDLKQQLGEGGQSEDAVLTLEALSQKVDEALMKLDSASADIGNIPLLALDISEIKEKLSALGGVSVQKNADAISNSDDIVEQLNILSDKTNEIIERSESGALKDETLQLITSEIEEIKDRLSADYEKIQDDISFIRNQIEINVEDSAEAGEADTGLGEEDFNTILDELTSIKEKLNATDEYDVMAEILSLREDVKASRLADQSEVSGELETVKAELNDQNLAIIEEIKNLRNDLSDLVRTDRTQEPTNDEVNMVLSEIVSLRDEIQSYKDEFGSYVTAMTEEKSEEEPSAVVDATDDTMTVILDELTSMRSELTGFKEETQEKQAEEIEPLKNELSGLQDGIAELKDMIIRRTTLNAEKTENVDENVVSASGLDVVLNELINLKDDFEAVRAQMSEEINAVKDMVSEEKPVENEELSEKLAAIEESVSAVSSQIADWQLTSATQAQEPVFDDKYDKIMEAIESVKLTAEEKQSDNNDDFDVLSEMLLLHDEINDVKNSLLSREAVAQDGTVLVDYSAVNEEIKALREQIENTQSADYSAVLDQLAEIKQELSETKQVSDDGLRNELAEIKELLIAQRQSSESSEELEMLRNEVLGLRQELSGESFAAQSAQDVGMTAEIMSLREDIAALKEQMTQAVAGISETAATQEPDMTVLAEIMSLRDELSALKEQAAAQPQAVQEPDMTVLTEIMALRDEIGELRSKMLAPDNDLVETVEQIREDVRVMKDEPDLSALSEVLALRDEFQAMKNEISDKTGKNEHVKSNEEILAEVQSLRDQLFAISMANVNDGSTDKVTYESYNNIILDEITALREELNSYKASDSTQAVIDEIAEIKTSIAEKTVDEKDLMAQLSKLKLDLEALKTNEAKDATNNAILEELANLKNELTNQREADLTTLNFMSEMAHLIERQNQYINQNANSKITDEIESLKAEIASSLATPSAETSAIMNEIAKLKEEIALSAEEEIDNQTILDELTKLKDEISNEKPSHQNTIVLEEIARLKNEISALSAKESHENKDVSVEEISQSITDLKNELTQIADMVGEENEKQQKAASKPKTAAKKAAPRKAAKTGAKKAPSDSKEALSSDELISKIEATSIEIPRNDAVDAEEFNPNLNFNYQQPIGKTNDLDLASKLAKQVANKLIMEQLVVQLGDGGVPENRVEEIVKDILPQEFSTVQMEEQSDQVRRLANSLVLDKLRARLTGKNDKKE